MISSIPQFLASRKEYLKSRGYSYVFVGMLMFGFLYQQLTGITSYDIAREILLNYSRLMIYTSFVGLISLFFKFPRWIFYAVLLLMALVHITFFTQVISKLDHDEFSTRDAAVEMTTQALLLGNNPWNNVSELGVAATTGPASILLAIPVVLVFGEINWLALLFWCIFFVILLVDDIQEMNNTFPVLIMLFVIGLLGFTHTLYWSLEEFYFPYLFIMFAYWSIIKSRHMLAGFLLAVAVLIRLNYIFIIIAFLLWYGTYKKFITKDFIKIGIGSMIAAIIIITPFILIGDTDFVNYNPFRTAFALSNLAEWPANNLFYQLLNFLGRNVSETWLRIIKLLVVVGLLTIASRYLRKLPHPFVHITIAAFLTVTVAWISPDLPNDYILLIAIPAFIAVSLLKSGVLGTPSNSLKIPTGHDS